MSKLELEIEFAPKEQPGYCEASYKCSCGWRVYTNHAEYVVDFFKAVATHSCKDPKEQLLYAKPIGKPQCWKCRCILKLEMHYMKQHKPNLYCPGCLRVRYFLPVLVTAGKPQEEGNQRIKRARLKGEPT